MGCPQAALKQEKVRSPPVEMRRRVRPPKMQRKTRGMAEAIALKQFTSPELSDAPFISVSIMRRSTPLRTRSRDFCKHVCFKFESFHNHQLTFPNIFPERANTSVGTPKSCFIITSRSQGFFVRQMDHFCRKERWNEYHGETSTVLISGKSVP
jgi:hypothetical protein